MVGTILEKIVETKRREVAESRQARPLAVVQDAIDRASPPRDFYDAIVGGDISLIAEIKKASPSAGLIRPDFDPVAIASDYAAAGASALSVLTDQTYFQGDLSYIELVKSAVTIPALRKDFVVDEYQVYESRAAGADAILLIAAVLAPDQIDAWSRLAFELGMSSLIEVHDEAERDAVSQFASPKRRAILGVNNRNLATQTTQIDTTERLAAGLAAGTPFVAESGIKTRDDVEMLQRVGAAAMLVGETLMREPDISAGVRRLLGK